MFNQVAYTFLLLLFICCSFSVFYLFIFSIAGKFFYKEKYVQSANKPFAKIAVLIPGYKEDNVILSTAKNILHSDYPKELFEIFVIADSFKRETLNELRKLPVQVLEVYFEKSTKTKSLNAAFDIIKNSYDIALICDADNMLAPDFLRKVNRAFSNGAMAVQGKRVAKNIETSFAVLDACSEAINNNIFRKGTYALGLSSAVIGSGMAFDFNTIKKIFSEIDAVGGFDKILQLKVAEQNIKIHYIESALIFDEKVNSSAAFEQQRKRWVSSQFVNLKHFFFKGCKQVFKGNFSYFNFAILNNIVLPRAFLLLILPFLTIAFYFFMSPFWFSATLIILVCYIISLVVALPFAMVDKSFFTALTKVPKAIAVMFGALIHIKKSNKNFIHTVHTQTEITNKLFNERIS